MNEELVYLFTYTLGNGTVGEVKIKANNFDNAYEKFDEWKVEKGLNSDLDSSIVELKYRLSGLTDIYLKEQCNVDKNKYILINMETLRIDLVKKDLGKMLVPFDIADSVMVKDEKELLNMLWNIIGDYEKNKKRRYNIFIVEYNNNNNKGVDFMQEEKILEILQKDRIKTLYSLLRITLDNAKDEEKCSEEENELYANMKNLEESIYDYINM